MSADLDPLYQDALTDLAHMQDMSEKATLQAALRLYQMHTLAVRLGHEPRWYDADGVRVDNRPLGSGGCGMVD